MLVMAIVVVRAEDEPGNKRFSLNGTLTSSYSYSLDVSFHYMFGRYIGVGGAFGYWANYYEFGWASGVDWWITDEDNKPSGIYLRPSAVIKSPGLKYRATTWFLYAEPGLLLNIPYRRVCIEDHQSVVKTDYDYISTNKEQWFAGELRLGVCANIGPLDCSFGYMMSNFDIYSQQRHLSYKGVSFRKFYEKKSVMYGAFLSVSYCFGSF